MQGVHFSELWEIEDIDDFLLGGLSLIGSKSRWRLMRLMSCVWVNWIGPLGSHGPGFGLGVFGNRTGLS